MRYRGKALELLNRYNAEIGKHVKVFVNNDCYEGVLMPRYEFADDEHVVLKLKNGYNIGIKVDRIDRIEVEDYREHVKVSREEHEDIEGLARLMMISTGGTIASKIDYRTGGVKAILTADELYKAIPELRSIARIDTQVLFNEYSENLKQEHWSKIAKAVYEKSKQGYDGIIITHGTDTMHYTSAALSFALRLKIPIVLVGAQRSSDRPSSDAASNLIASSIFASKSKYSGVFIAMHDNMSDDKVAIHIGTRVRKNHTSRRDAFRSIGIKPFAYVNLDDNSITYNYELDTNAKEEFKPEFDDRVALLKYYPNMDPRILINLVDVGYKGIIIEGTGLGHVGKHMFNGIEYAIKNGVIVCMASQCINGRVRMTVYETGRDLLRLGVIPLEDMLAEVAYVKLSWVLANTSNTEEARSLMLKNIAYEINPRSSIAYNKP